MPIHPRYETSLFTKRNNRFFADMNERMQTKVVGMHLEEGFLLTPQLLEAEILRRKEEGGNVKGFLFCNPNNPLGVVYPRELAIQLMEVCKRHKVMSCSYSAKKIQERSKTKEFLAF